MDSSLKHGDDNVVANWYYHNIHKIVVYKIYRKCDINSKV